MWVGNPEIVRSLFKQWFKKLLVRTQSQNAVHENSLDVANGLSRNASSILKKQVKQ